jgi:hypothetical protein
MWIVWLEKKILKTIGILLGIFIVLVTALHIYVVNNAEKLIEDLVKTESKDKLRLRVNNIKFNYFTRKVELQQVVFYSNDSMDISTSYRFSVDNIKLRIKALIPIFTRKELLVDSIYLSAPHIVVTRLKPLDTAVKKDISIPEEMGRIYNSIIDALKKFQVTRFELNEGSFTLENKVKPEQIPLTITNLHIHIDNFKIDTISQHDNLLFSDQMVFRTRNQDILFPDGNHRLAFSRFRINIRRKIIEIDSCTLSGKRTDNSRSGFNVFLDTLKLVNVDFKALYESELIKADSVFCRNPVIKFQFELKEKNAARNKLPNMDTIIQQLTGDLLLKYIGVTNAGIDITTYRGNKPSSFTSDKNNFEMTGLSIDQKSTHPVSLEGFDMAIRNYENYIKDSSYVLRFDSILLRESRILLSNFSINTEPFKDNRNIKVRQFALSGLSWSDLLFNRRINASQATLYHPVIDFVQPEIAKAKKGRGFSNTLDAVDKFMDLQKIQIVDGQINISGRNKTELLLQNANLLMNTRDVTTTPTVSSVEKSVEDLYFSKGILRFKNLTVNMDNAFYDGKKLTLALEKINIYSPMQFFNISARNTILQNVQFDEALNLISADGINWDRAAVEINILSKENTQPASPLSFILNNITGNNTQADINSEKGSASVFLNSLSLKKISRGEKIVVDEFKATGKELTFFSPGIEVQAAKFSLSDFNNSVFTSFQLKQTKGKNSTSITVPELSLIPDLNSIISGITEVKNVKLLQPVFNLNITEKATPKKTRLFPDFTINSIEINGPEFSIKNSVSKKLSLLNWNGNDNSLVLENIQSSKSNNQISIASARGEYKNISIADSSGKTKSTGEGFIRAQFENTRLQPGEKMIWQTTLKELTAINFATDSLGKKPATVKLKEAKIENLNISSDLLGSLPLFVKNNPAFSISNVSGYIIDEKNNLQLHNLSFTNASQLISLDSFSYHPVKSRDEFISASHFQTDYMTLTTGKININKFNLSQYLEDSIVRLGDVSITNPYFTSYRDKRPPFNAGIIKPLAAKMIQKIPVKIFIDTIKIQNGKTVYTEVSDKTNEAGIVPVTRISGDIFPIKNINITNTDSLRIRLNGYLMDTAWLRLRTRESYLDTLSGFLLTLRMRPGNLDYLNPVLAPLASVKLQSGYLDTLNMRVVGQEYISLGVMRMYYHDLKVQFLRNDTEEKKRFLKGLITFIANSFVIKNKNDKRTGVVYFPRLRDRSFINYYIKIAMSGVASSIGAKKNKKLLHKYQKQIKLRQLPPIDFD